jgi:hypothetical protein
LKAQEPAEGTTARPTPLWIFIKKNEIDKKMFKKK